MQAAAPPPPSAAAAAAAGAAAVAALPASDCAPYPHLAAPQRPVAPGDVPVDLSEGGLAFLLRRGVERLEADVGRLRGGASKEVHDALPEPTGPDAREIGSDCLRRLFVQFCVARACHVATEAHFDVRPRSAARAARADVELAFAAVLAVDARNRLPAGQPRPPLAPVDPALAAAIADCLNASYAPRGVACELVEPGARVLRIRGGAAARSILAPLFDLPVVMHLANFFMASLAVADAARAERLVRIAEEIFRCEGLLAPPDAARAEVEHAIEEEDAQAQAQEGGGQEIAVDDVLRALEEGAQEAAPPQAQAQAQAQAAAEASAQAVQAPSQAPVPQAAPQAPVPTAAPAAQATPAAPVAAAEPAAPPRTYEGHVDLLRRLNGLRHGTARPAPPGARRGAPAKRAVPRAFGSGAATGRIPNVVNHVFAPGRNNQNRALLVNQVSWPRLR